MKKGLIIVVVLVVLAGLGYGGYKVMHKMQVAATPSPTPEAMKAMPTTEPSPSAMAMENSVYKMATDPKLGSIMTDLKGMTLYTYDKDTTGVSNCSGKCLAAWPAYVAPATTGTLPANVSVIKRSDGTMQYAWKGMPLYYYIKDKAAGDVTGDMVGGVWHVVKNTDSMSVTPSK